MILFIETAEWISNLFSSIGLVIALYTFFAMLANKISKKNKIKCLKIWLTLLVISFGICFITFFMALILNTFNVSNIAINFFRLIAIYVVYEVIQDIRQEN